MYVRVCKSLQYIVAVPVNERENENSPVPTGNTSTNAGFSVAMLVYQRVYSLLIQEWQPVKISRFAYLVHSLAEPPPSGALFFVGSGGGHRFFCGGLLRPHSTSTAWKSKASSTRTSNPRIGECNIASLFFPSPLWAQSTISILGPRFVEIFYHIYTNAILNANTRPRPILLKEEIMHQFHQLIW